MDNNPEQITQDETVIKPNKIWKKYLLLLASVGLIVYLFNLIYRAFFGYDYVDFNYSSNNDYPGNYYCNEKYNSGINSDNSHLDIGCNKINREIVGKPVIYLYPKSVQDTTVQLDYKGTFIATYPEYDYKIGGWKVRTYPDSKIINYADGREYSYLFWEGINYSSDNWDLSTGFVVKGTNTREFLQDKLSKLGLSPREYNEFIVYWYPLMKNNKYNLVHFAGKEYTDMAKLTITPKPDSILRVFMLYKPLEDFVNIPEQNLNSFDRKGFSVIEWGGSEVR